LRLDDVGVADELVTIGTFSMLTGLSISTLRYYDDIGLLRPAEVDSRTGYRRYRSVQVDRARRVRLLREAELSTEDIARMLDGDAADGRAVLARRRSMREHAAAFAVRRSGGEPGCLVGERKVIT
jgi:DNA-binding transcriptional MerR regulator